MANGQQTALIIGNSDGIGLALTKRLLGGRWTVTGLSRSPAPIDDPAYRHIVQDVSAPEYPTVLSECASTPPAVCVYCAGIGLALDLHALHLNRTVFEVNLMAAVRTIEIVLPAMIERQTGHILILSSIADSLIAEDAPSYTASKSGLSSYVEGLALQMRKSGVALTNVRFGFVDTKMAQARWKPMRMSVERAVDHLLHCLRTRPIRYTRPRTIGASAWLLRAIQRLQTVLTHSR